MKLAALLAITTTLACNVQTDADTKFAIRKKTADKSGAAQEKTTMQGANYFPLAIGNEWVLTSLLNDKEISFTFAITAAGNPNEHICDRAACFNDPTGGISLAPREGKNGRPKTYSNDAILLALTMLTLYKLNYRSAEGFIRGLFALMKIALPVPDYTTLCRRMKFLSVEYRRSIEKMRGRPVDLVFDSTGLKVYGRGEWKTKPTHRFNVKNWKMLHLGMTVEGFQIKELELTTCKTSDNQAFAHMLRRMEDKVGKVYGDKAYLATECFNLIDGKGGTAVIDLKPNMKLASAEIVRENPGLEQRNRILLDIRRCGKSGWKERSGYHRRSLIECQMNRFKGRFGEALFSRKHSHQVTEVKIKAMILNKLSSLGMPMTTAVS